MANEITASMSFRATKGGATVSFQDRFIADLTEQDMVNQTQLIGTSAEAIDIGDINGGVQFLIVKNLDATNTVEIGSDVTGADMFITLQPGKFCMFSPNTEDLYAIADTAAVRVLILAVET